MTLAVLETHAATSACAAMIPADLIAEYRAMRPNARARKTPESNAAGTFSRRSEIREADPGPLPCHP